jgi:DNA-binding NarL/FixJ family response regulator
VSSLTAVQWGVPWLREPLAACGIDYTDAAAAAAVIALASDNDLCATRRLIRSYPGIAVLALVPHDAGLEDAARVIQAIELGVTSVLPADTATAEIAATLVAIAEGPIALSAFASHLVVRGLRARCDVRGRYTITARERDVLSLLVQGRTVAQIADCLGVGFHTAQTHVKNLYRKLEVGSKAEATAIALRHQLV